MEQDCLIGYYQGKAGEEILETYARVRREIFLNYIDKRSIKNLDRVAKADPWNVLETDKFFGIIKELNKDKKALKEFLLVCMVSRHGRELIRALTLEASNILAFCGH